MIEALIYFGVGLLVYLLAYGPVDWADAWVYVIASLWPFVLLWWALPYALAVAAIVLFIAAGISAWDWVRKRKRVSGPRSP
jgi:hypothetical protein